MMSRVGIIALLALLNLGCATPEQRHARVEEHMQRDLAPICTTAGRTPGTDAHFRCILTLYREESVDDVTIAASLDEPVGVYLHDIRERDDLQKLVGPTLLGERAGCTC